MSPPLKAKSAMDESLDFSLPWDSFVYNFKKSYVVIDLARLFYLCYLMIELGGHNDRMNDGVRP